MAKKSKKMVIGRGGRQVEERKYKLLAAEVTAYKAEFDAGEKIPNPFNKGTKYFALEALKALGANRNHSWTRFIEKFKELASASDTKNEDGKTFWQVFKGKEPRNEKTGLNWEGRLEQTLEVCQRTGGNHPYAQPLLDMGSKVLGTAGITIDIVHGSTGEVMVHLNTDSATPKNETKRQPASPEQKAKKVYTGKKRGRKPKVVTGAIPETAAEPTVAEPTVETVPTVEPIQEATEPAVPVQAETSEPTPVQDGPSEAVIQSDTATPVTAESSEVQS
jgi:hypothetical protein